jgi:hypothetical protein
MGQDLWCALSNSLLEYEREMKPTSVTSGSRHKRRSIASNNGGITIVTVPSSRQGTLAKTADQRDFVEFEIKQVGRIVTVLVSSHPHFRCRAHTQVDPKSMSFKACMCA